MQNGIREKYLPVGSVVMLKGGKKRIMIIGFCLIPEDDQTKMYDYTGCLYPEGVVDSKRSLMFNHDQIERIDFLGLEDEEETQFKKKLKEVIAKQTTNSSIPNNQVTNNVQEIRINN